MTPPPSPPRRRLVAADPDARSLRGGWILWAIGTAVLIVASLATPPERLPLMVVLAAALLLWPLWRGGRRVIHVVLDSAHAPWQGVYYEFDGRQIRILVDDTEALWFCAADVFAVLEIAAGGREPARARLAAGRDGLRHAPGTRMLCFTERGLAAWLERRTERRVATFERWLQTQVIGPHHRKLELAGLSARTQTRAE
ncbi:MAG: hypothetical protein U5L03_11590 [Burkholderiaceae bacterium]|nr:hypothetical protein [Burkholderiaceae bacterium]